MLKGTLTESAMTLIAKAVGYRVDFDKAYGLMDAADQLTTVQRQVNDLSEEISRLNSIILSSERRLDRLRDEKRSLEENVSVLMETNEELSTSLSSLEPLAYCPDQAVLDLLKRTIGEANVGLHSPHSRVVIDVFDPITNFGLTIWFNPLDPNSSPRMKILSSPFREECHE